MILLDASVIIDMWKHPDQEKLAILRSQNCCICGITKAELMHGAKSEKDLAAIEQSASGIRFVHIPEATWNDLGRNLFLLRKAGLPVPFQDVVLATLAIREGFALWGRDSHFPLIQGVLKDLVLFDPDNPDHRKLYAPRA